MFKEEYNIDFRREKKTTWATLFSSMYMDGSDDTHMLSLETLSIFVSI